jgi:hypothetical protein
MATVSHWVGVSRETRAHDARERKYMVAKSQGPGRGLSDTKTAGGPSRSNPNAGSTRGGGKKSSGVGGLLDMDFTPTGPSRFGTGGDLSSGQGQGQSNPTPSVTKKNANPLPEIPDNNVITNPDPVDLSPIVEAPARKPVRSALGSFAGSVGITGSAGVN